jgi:hypothetical protein
MAETDLTSEYNTTNKDDQKMYYSKLGYDFTGFSDMGSTSVALSYRQTDDLATDADKAEAFSLLMVQNLKDYGTAIYGGLSNFQYDTAAANFDDINGIFMGAKVSF